MRTQYALGDPFPLAQVLNVSSSGEDRDHINPYRRRVSEYPGRLFTFVDHAAELEIVRARIASGETVCEIGSGSGRHLLEIARRTPHIPVFGIELRFKRAVRTIEKALREGLGGVNVLLMDGRGIAQVFPPRSLRALYVNFPDPWPKVRWRKNRLLNDNFLREAAGLLRPGGTLLVKTDHAEYFEGFLALLRTSSHFAVRDLTCDLYASRHAQENVPTEFELLFRGQNCPIRYVCAERASVSDSIGT